MKGNYFLVKNCQGQFLAKRNMRVVAEAFGLSWDALQRQMKKNGRFYDKKTGTSVEPYVLEADFVQVVAQA